MLSSSSPPPVPPGESYASHYQRGYNPNFAPQQQPRTSGGFSDGHSQEADPFQVAQHRMPSPLQNPHPHDPYEAYANVATSPEPGSDEGGAGAGAGGQHSGRSDDGRMSLLDEEDYGRQPRMLKVCVCFVCFPPIYVLPFSFPYFPPPLLRFYAISNVFGVSTSQAGNRWAGRKH